MTEAGQGTGDQTARRSRWARWLGGAPGRATDALELLDAPHPEALDAALPAELLHAVEAHGWTVLRNLHRPGRGGATVTLLAVGPGGVVVVEPLRWDGEVQVVEGTLRHRGYGRTPEVAAAVGTAGAVTALLTPSHRRAGRAVVCLIGRDLRPVPVHGGAVAVGSARLAEHLTGLPVLLAPAEVALVVDHLVAQLGGPTGPDQLTVDDVLRPMLTGDANDVPRPYGSAIPRVGPSSRRRPTHGTGAPSGSGPVPTSLPGPGPAGTGTAHVDGAARGDGLLRASVLVLGVLTAGNLLLAWLSAGR
ncbi:MAG TPA: hypothetical protein VGC67_10685 [Cellulomonas sp.]